MATVMANDEAWKTQAAAFGEYLRTQRRLAELSLRGLAEQSQVSNAYLSQLERGLHQPSIRVLRALAEALHLPPDRVLAHAGVLRFADDTRPAGTGDNQPESAEALVTPDVETAIRADPQLTRIQQDALLTMYRSYLPG
jgi:transcriptional regulator with XRE-family HTH domain